MILSATVSDLEDFVLMLWGATSIRDTRARDEVRLFRLVTVLKRDKFSLTGSGGDVFASAGVL